MPKHTFEAFLEHYQANWAYLLSSLDSYFLVILFFLLPWKIFQIVDKCLIQNTWVCVRVCVCAYVRVFLFCLCVYVDV